MLAHLKAHLQGRVVILGMGNTLRSDDGAGSILASRIKERLPYQVFDVGVSPENYLGKIIEVNPETIVIIDAVDFGGRPGDFNLIDGIDLKTINLFFTHNASLALTINYLKNNLKADIIILVIQPKAIGLGDNLSPEISETLNKLENWFYDAGKEKG